jgi:type VI secretion system FHA domain protein
LTIGRGEENDLSLPDPDRLLSKRHCVLEERNGDYFIIDTSTNGTFLNYGAERLGAIPTPLNHGDVILLGPFELAVDILAVHGPDPRAGQPLPPAEESRIVPGSSLRPHEGVDFDDPLADAPGSLDDFLGPALDDPLGPLDGSSGHHSGWAPPALPSDPFAGPPPSTGPSFDLGSPLESGSLQGRESSPFGGNPSRDGASVSDHGLSERDSFSAPSVQQPLIPDDWDDLISSGDPLASKPVSPFQAPFQEKAQPAAQDSPPFDPPPAAPEEAFSPSPPPRANPQGPAPGPTPAQAPASQTHSGHPASGPPPSGQAGVDAAARAFLAATGAGHLDIPEAELEETMARLGRVFAAMVTGMREILMARAVIKSEMRMNRTMIGTGNNNPMKFSINPEQAIEAMIRPSVRGYLDAEAATTEALKDIRAHEIAMMAGMEAALKDLLTRLSPDRLSGRIEAGAKSGGLFGGKKARYWEAYETLYAQIARETEDDFQSTFGREFARAYEDQSRKL